MLEYIEKLRKLRDEVEAHDVDNPIWVCSKATIIADEIERAISERYMPLPVDADGVPIHVGDPLECKANGYEGTFTVFAIGDNTVAGNHDIEWIRDNPTKWFHVASFCHHVKPRTVEDVLYEFGKAYMYAYTEGSFNGMNTGEIVSNCAEELRDMLDD